MTLIRQTVETFGWQVAGFLAMAMAGMITARVLGPADRGLLAAVYLYPQLATLLGSLSLGVVIFHHLSQREFTAGQFAGTMTAAALGLGTVVLLLVILVLWWGGEALYRGIPLRMLLVAIFPLPWLFSLGYFSSLLQGVLDIRWSNLVNHGAKLVSLAVVLMLFACGRLRVWDLIIAGSLLTMAMASVAAWRLRRHLPGPWHCSPKLFRVLAGHGLRIHLGAVMIFVAGRANLFLANVYLTKSEVGYLYLAIALAELIWFVSISAETVLYPQVSQMNTPEAAILTARVCRQVLALSGFVGLALIVCAPAAVLLYGGRAFLPATVPLRLLVPGVVALVISKILSAIWVREGWFGTLAIFGCGTGILSVALNAALIPRLGLSGAALATTSAYAINAACSLLVYWRWVSRDLRAVWCIRGDDITHLVKSLWDLQLVKRGLESR